MVADRTTRQVTATWKLREAGRNFPMALDAANKRLYVGCRRAAKLLVIDTESGRVVASPECVGDADDLFVDAKTGRVLVVGGDGAIDVFEANRHDLAPQCPGVYAVLIGLSHMFQDDHEQLRHGMIVCDALYAWCKHARGEKHDWNPQKAARSPA